MNDAITKWLTVLAGLVNPALPADALESLMAMWPHIRSEFSPQWLTPETARAVAEAKRYTAIPGWDVIATTLREHIRQSRPIVFGRIAAPREPDWPEPSPEQVACVERITAEYEAWRKEQHSADEPKS